MTEAAAETSRHWQGRKKVSGSASEKEGRRVGTGRRPVPDACAAANVASVDL